MPGASNPTNRSMQGKIKEGLKQAEDDYDKEQNEIKYTNREQVTGGNKTGTTTESKTKHKAHKMRDYQNKTGSD